MVSKTIEYLYIILIWYLISRIYNIKNHFVCAYQHRNITVDVSIFIIHIVS